MIKQLLYLLAPFIIGVAFIFLTPILLLAIS